MRMTAIKMLGAAYILIGALNAIILWATVSHNDCINASGVLGIYCNASLGVMHAVAVLLWPFFWL